MLPRKLRSGDAIAVFSPSSPATATAPTRYRRGRGYLEEKGLRFIEGERTGKRDFYRSGSIAERAQELNALIRNPEVRCIMAAIGGMNSNSLLPYLDYEALMRDPKIIVGYSDVTALLLGVYARTGLTTYYGPAVVASFGELPPWVDWTWSAFADVAMGMARPPHALPVPDQWTEEFIDWETQSRAKRGVANEMRTLHGGRVRGRLIGGNLNTMQGIWGTPYMPKIREGDVLLIEDSLKDAADVERSFSLLKLSGVFERIGGLILGKHELFDDLGSGRRPWEILMEVMGNVDFPVLAQFDCCHTHPMLTLPIGCEVELDADAQTLTLTQPFIGD
ncbi:MAG: LD-carboxypeptidase [Eubacteriales bacterium]|nr:LD-carboxypeptidase [Eubacteriales bacterium]